MDYLQVILTSNFLYIPNPKNNGTVCYRWVYVICTSDEVGDEYFISDFC